MKGFLFSFALVATLLFSGAAEAQNCNLYSCATTITVDAGNSGLRCDDSGTCTYASLCAGCICKTVTAGSSCGSGWSWIDKQISDGKEVCAKWGGGCALATGEIVSQDALTEVQTDASSSLETVFMPGLQTYGYYGIVNSVNKSPSTGRSAAAKAKLDACLFYSDVDSLEAAAGSSTQTRWEYCVGSTYGCANTIKNDYCESNGAAVCIDRCDCAYPGATGSDGCSNL